MRILHLLLGAVILAFSIWFLDWKVLLESLGRLHTGPIVQVLLLCEVLLLLVAWRWQRIVHDIVDVPVREHLQYFLLGNYLNTFTPANLGGDIYRVVMLVRAGGDRNRLIAAAFAEKSWGLGTYLIVFLVCYAVMKFAYGGASSPEIDAMAIIICMVAVAGGGGLLIIPHIEKYVSACGRFRRIAKLSNFIAGALHAHKPVVQVQIFILSLLNLGLWVFAAFILAQDLEIDVTIPELALVAILTEIVRIIPISAQGIGIREGAYSYLFYTMGYSPQDGFILGASIYIILTIIFAVNGMVGWLLGQTAPAK